MRLLPSLAFVAGLAGLFSPARVSAVITPPNIYTYGAPAAFPIRAAVVIDTSFAGIGGQPLQLIPNAAGEVFGVRNVGNTTTMMSVADTGVTAISGTTAGMLTTTNSSTGLAFIASNTGAPGGGVAASIQRTNAGTALQIGDNVTLTNWTATAAGATTQAANMTVSAGGITVTGASTITAAAAVPLALTRTGAGGNAFTINDGTTTNFAATAAGSWTASLAAGVSGPLINYAAGTGGAVDAFRVQAGSVNGFRVYQTASQFALDIGPTTTAWGAGGTTINIQTPSGTSPTITSGAATGAYTGYAFTLANSPTTFATFGSVATFPGIAPASVAGNGTNAVDFTFTGPAGGASSGVTGQTGGIGSDSIETLGAGGAVAGASGIGGKGGSKTITTGGGGNGAATGGAAGDYLVTIGNAGTGGNANGGNVTFAMGTKTGSGTAGLFAIKGGAASHGSLFQIQTSAGANSLTMSDAGLVTTYNAEATASGSTGVPYITSQGYQVAWTGAATNILSYAPSATGLYIIMCSVSVTTADTVTVQATWVDDVNATAQTANLINAVAIGANSTASGTRHINARTGTNIIVTISTAGQVTTKGSGAVWRVR